MTELRESKSPDLIFRAETPEHNMRITPVSEKMQVSVTVDNVEVVVAVSEHVLQVDEVYKTTVLPSMYYFPRNDVNISMLQKSTKATTCVLKGETEYFDLVVGEAANGKKLIEEAAWSYITTYDYDPRVASIGSCIAFDTTQVSVEKQ